MSKKVTIYDIAKRLHVTPATVSYALNNVSKISEETRKKILDTAREMGYSRDYNAVSLSTGKTHLIALFLPFEDISKAFLENPFYGEFIGVFGQQIKKKGYDLFIQSEASEKDLLPWLRGRGVDAIAILGNYPKHYRKALKTYGKPVVLVDVFDEHSDEYNNVIISDGEGCYNATKYLIECGHRNIAFVAGDIKNSIVDQRRFDGYRKALEDNGITFNENYLFVSEVSFDGGVNLANKLMSYKDITAIMCAADTLAIGTIYGYRNAGKNVPEDLSVIGFDDIQSAKMIYPALTTVRQDINYKARIAAELILKDLENNEIGHEIRELSPELIIRESVKKN